MSTRPEYSGVTHRGCTIPLLLKGLLGYGSLPRLAIGYLAALAIFLAVANRVGAGSPDKDQRIHLVNERMERWRMGVTVQAGAGAVTGIVATLPMPMDWPEQEVKVVAQDVSPNVRSVRYRILGGTVKQMVVTIPRLGAGREAQALVTLEITRRDIAPPMKTEDLKIPNLKTLNPKTTALRKYLKPGPYIESQDRKIQQLAKQLVAGEQQAWARVEAIYDWVRSHVEYRFAREIKSARKAMDDGYGDCEELSSLFIAICRAAGIPARLVWVPGHCYPEFYLVDAEGRGYWFSCQAAGTRSFGGISESRPILQKGDRFRVPGSRRPMRYVQETLTAKNAQANPAVKFVRKRLDVADSNSATDRP